MKLTQEHREAIAVTADSEGWEALQVLLTSLLEDRRSRVLTYSLTQGPEGLVHEKARAEGAELLYSALRLEVERIKKSEK